ncbi:MAG: transglutaminase-like domain-containing protein [Fuerstiella sp.]|nr:transglutaminase-like domain-containing protein [Fuerstiella sp.]
MSPEVVSRRLSRSERVLQRTGSGPQASEITASLRLHVICVVLSLLAAFIFTLTEHDDHRHTLWCIFEITIQTLLVITTTIYFRRRITLLKKNSVVVPILVMVASLSLICEPIQRLFFDTGHAFEILVMHSQCNLMLALAVCGFRLQFQRLAVLIAVFMTIFCYTISDAAGLLPLTVLFAVVAVTWLVAAWWETVDRRIVSPDQGRLPKTWLVTGAMLPLLTMLAAGGFGANSVTTALEGFMPSSGGTGNYDPFSRGGVNDGDALIAGNKNIKSFAPIEDAPFVDSVKPSLYDVLDDQFDGPAKKIKNQQRAIALPPEMMKHIHRKMAEARQAGREFSLLRSEKQANDDPIGDLKTHALFYVAGRTPVHLRMEVYDLFDGVEWAPYDTDQVDGLQMTEMDDRFWLGIPQSGKGFELFSGTATHSIKNANLDGNTVPTPPHPVGVSIDEVNRSDMYVVRENGIVSLNRNSVPAMTSINFVSRCVDRKEIEASDWISITRHNSVRTVNELSVSLPYVDKIESIRRLAVQLTDKLPRGWTQIAEVERYLRQNYKIHRDTKATDQTAPINEFLFQTRRGPEYLFASSAVVMLRTLGYQARLVSGFYARPDRYDSKKRHTPVYAEDAHFWCEVSLGADLWLTIEPSPGYGILQPPLGLAARLWNLLVTVGQLAADNVILIVLLAALTAGGLFNRHRIQDRLLTWRWQTASRKQPRRRALELAQLVDHRLRLVGMTRKAGTTLRRWSGQPVLAPVRQNLTRLVDLADEAKYRRSTRYSIDTKELEDLARQLSYTELRKILNRSAANSDKSHAV